MDSRKLKIAVVGMGKMGLLHTSLLSTMNEVQVVALCEQNKIMNRLLERMFPSSGTVFVNRIDELLSLHLDAVYVTTPIATHSVIIRNLLSKKISRNIFVEKTLASNFKESQELCSLAENVGGTTMVGYMKRFSVIFRKAKELLHTESLGEPQQFHAYAYSSDFSGLTKESKSSASRGGALSDLGCHVIDLALWLFGELQFHDISSVEKEESGFETSVSFNVSNSKGISGIVDVSQSMQSYRMPEFGLSIECSKGKVEVNDDRLILTSGNGAVKKWYRHNLNDNVAFSLGEAEFFRENKHFVSSVLNNNNSEIPFDDASDVDFVIEQVRNKSAEL